MITYEEAKKKANNLVEGINKAIERKDAFVFENTEQSGKYPGGPGLVVIMKDDGRALGYSQYAIIAKDYGRGKRIKL